MDTLLVAYDFSDSSKKAAQFAIKLAEKFHSHIWLLNVVEPEPEFIGFKTGPKTVREQVALEYHADYKKLQDLEKELRKNYSNISALSVQGATVDTILSQADKLDASLILVGSHSKTNLKILLLGSVSENVVKSSTRPVLVCR